MEHVNVKMVGGLVVAVTDMVAGGRQGREREEGRLWG